MELHIGFYTFTVKCIVMHLSTTENEKSATEVEKQLASYRLSQLASITCAQSFLILSYAALLHFFCRVYWAHLFA